MSKSTSDPPVLAAILALREKWVAHADAARDAVTGTSVYTSIVMEQVRNLDALLPDLRAALAPRQEGESGGFQSACINCSGQDGAHAAGCDFVRSLTQFFYQHHAKRARAALRLTAANEFARYVLSLDECAARETIWKLLTDGVLELTPDRHLVRKALQGEPGCASAP